MSDARADRDGHSIRIFFWISVAFAAILIAALALAKPARALTVGPLPNVLPGAETALGEEDDGEEDEDWESWEEAEWEDEEAEEELEEKEAKREEARQSKVTLLAPAECLLRGADAKAVVYASQDKLSLTIRYLALAPVDAIVDYKLRGGKGSLSLGGTQEHFAKQGVLHQTERLTKSQAVKARAARDVTVQFRLSDAPQGCGGSFTKHLTVKRALPNQVTWVAADSAFGSARHRR